MEGIDDILGHLDGGDTAFQDREEPKKQFNNSGNSSGGWGNNKSGYNNNRSNKPKEPDFWDKKDITPLKVSSTGFIQSKSFTIAVPRDVTVPEPILKFFSLITEHLTSKGYAFRFGAHEENKLQKTLFDIAAEHKQVEVHLPWKKFNIEAAEDPSNISTTIRPNELAYGVAVNYNQSFYKFSPHIRAINANDAAIMLGNDIKHPLSMLVIYTECGSEAIAKKMDWKKISGLSLLLTLAEESNIPVYNLKNEESRKKLSAKLNALSTPEQN
jgi:hypothetical protein